MGGSYYSRDDHKARSTLRAASKAPVFKHTAAVTAGTTAAKVHSSLDPKGVTLRESRDSTEHPVTLPIAVLLDTTGSMAKVPEILERRLSALMGSFLEDKASGKKYLGDAYPAIMIGGIDDYDAMGGRGNGAFQAGQFESGIEIDNDLENLWLTGRGGGTYEESYEIALYFMARHTAHDAMDKRSKKGYLFVIGDEHAYPQVVPGQVAHVIGADMGQGVSTESIIAEAQKLYHVFFIIPNLTQHYDDEELRQYWMGLLGQQNVIKLKDPEKICEAIVAAVAISERHAGIDDLVVDGVADGDLSTALVALSKSVSMQRSAAGLPVLGGTPGTVTRF